MDFEMVLQGVWIVYCRNVIIREIATFTLQKLTFLPGPIFWLILI
jgi:hypothetical protein